MRTNIDIDDELLRQVMAATGLTTKKATVEDALRFRLQLRRQESLLELFGKVHWEGDLNEDRADRFQGWAEDKSDLASTVKGE